MATTTDKTEVESMPQHLQTSLRRDLKAKKLNQRRHRSQLTLLQSPIKTITYFLWELSHHCKNALSLLYRHWLVTFFVLIALSALMVLRFVQGPHEEFVKYFFTWGTVGLEWVVLGVLSSVGLGTGLHTFVLYLGPFIAKVTLAATECNSVDFPTHGEGAFLCPSTATTTMDGATAGLAATAVAVTFWSILRKVQFEALSWGLGTAIGELPPYFVARAARLSGKKLEEVEGDGDADEDEGEEEEEETKKKKEDQADKNGPVSFTEKVSTKARSIMDLLMGRHPFITILIMASVPNPLFDLAGLTCGYALIPFWIFFGATMIGKAFIKAHLQAITVIIIFSKEYLAILIELIEWALPFLHGKAKAYFDKERQRFHPDMVNKGVSAAADGKSLLARTWDIVLITMLAMFAISIINSMAQSRMLEEQQKELEKYKRKRTAALLAKKDGGDKDY